MTFRDRVYEVTRRIPRGRVATYGQIARLSGNSKAARAVGTCMKTNPDAPQTPCHRVVASSGKLTGYSAAGGIAKKKKMLADEGVLFRHDTVDLARSLWNPRVT
ncbi:MAG: MGMT family protein [bacterium]|nr:MGMT family protein [bacterium]